MADKAEAKRQVKRIKNLPTMPGILHKIAKMVESPEASTSEVSRLISQDQVLSAKVLRMANSAFFGMSRQISSITQALIILGFNVIKGLILTTSVFDMMKKSMAGLWEHSIGCAAAAQILANRLGRKDAEEILVAGLLHDLGKVVLNLEMPEETARVVAMAESRALSFYEAEQEILGFNHQEVGMWLAEHWNLPVTLAEPMRLHHHPDRALAAQDQTAIVHVANIIIRARGLGFAGDPFVPPLSRWAWNRLGFNPEDFPGLLEELEPKLVSIQDFMG